MGYYNWWYIATSYHYEFMVPFLWLVAQGLTLTSLIGFRLAGKLRLGRATVIWAAATFIVAHTLVGLYNLQVLLIFATMTNLHMTASERLDFWAGVLTFCGQTYLLATACILLSSIAALSSVPRRPDLRADKL